MIFQSNIAVKAVYKCLLASHISNLILLYYLVLSHLTDLANSFFLAFFDALT